MEEKQWIFCPICKSKTRLQMVSKTEVKFLPLYCPKCKQETLIHIKDQKVYIASDICN